MRYKGNVQRQVTRTVARLTDTLPGVNEGIQLSGWAALALIVCAFTITAALTKLSLQTWASAPATHKLQPVAPSTASVHESKATTNGTLPPWCDAARRLQICAHRANASEVEPGLAYTQRITALVSRGILCSDVDVFKTADNLLVVGHTAELHAQLRKLNGTVTTPEHVRLSDMAAAGLANNFPLLRDLMLAFKLAVGSSSAARANPHLFLELKGTSFSFQSLVHVAQQAQLLSLDPPLVHVWFPSTNRDANNRLRSKLRASHVQLSSVIGYMDTKVESDGTRAKVEAQFMDADSSYDLFGPSIHHVPALYQNIKSKAAGKPVAVWVVDTEQDLTAALMIGADIAISNRPIALRAMLRQRLKDCQ